MRRRELLFGVGTAVGVSGCSSLQKSDDKERTKSLPTLTRTTELTQRSATRTQTAERTRTDSKGSVLVDLRQQVNRAESLYLQWEGISSDELLAVDLQSTPSSVDRIMRLLRSARREYTTYIDTHSDPGTANAERNRTVTLLDWVVVQRRLIDVFRLVATEATAALYDQRYDVVASRLERATSVRQSARERLHEHRRWNDSRDGPIWSIAPAVYDAKILQLRTGLDGLSVFTESLRRQETMVRGVTETLRRYLDGSLKPAEAVAVVETARRIERSRGEYCCGTDPIRRMNVQYRIAAAAVANGVEKLRRAYESDTRRALEREAKAAFETSALLAESDGPLRSLIDALPVSQ